MGLFRRRKPEDDTEAILAELGNAPSPVRSASERPVIAGDGQGGRLTVIDVFVITGRGLVVTGRVEAGSFRVGDPVVIERNGEVIRESRVTGIEAFRKILDHAVEGDNVGILLEAMKRSDIERDDIVVG